jgi:secreted PhoX family phosphatase
MDRPEGIAAGKVGGKVYLALTNNSRRKPEEVDAANPRAVNRWGHVVEMTPPDGDHTAGKFRWEILIRGGDPKVADVGAMYNPSTSDNGWFACPDNVAVDNRGRLWVATDQGDGWKKASGKADGVFAIEVEGALRGTSKMFFRVPVGAEMCGPLFAPDNRTFFCAVQHPAIDGAEDYAPFGRKTTFADPATRWPDFKPDMPPRPSVVVITKRDGGVIGS